MENLYRFHELSLSTVRVLLGIFKTSVDFVFKIIKEEFLLANFENSFSKKVSFTFYDKITTIQLTENIKSITWN